MAHFLQLKGHFQGNVDQNTNPLRSSVGPEQDEGAIDNSSPVLGGLVSDVQDSFDSGGGSFACGGENDC